MRHQVKTVNHKPGSVLNAAIYLGTALQPASVQPTRSIIGRAVLLLLDFAPDEVCHSGGVTNAAVGSYPTLSPLLATFG